MAREPSVLDDGSAGSSSPGDGLDSSGNGGLLHRRAYLRMAGAATAATAAVAATGTASADEYDVVDVPAGGHEVITLGSNDSLENVLIDVSAEGASFSIAAAGTNWTIRNVGIDGVNSTGGGGFGLADTGGGTSVVENVYFGDGFADVTRSGPAFWVRPDHTGTLEFDRVYVTNSNDNAFYGSAPGSNGVVNYRNCYSQDSWVAHYRLARGVVENCVAVNTSNRMEGRGVWAWAPGPVEVRDCDLVMNGHHYSFVAGAGGSSSTIAVEDTRYDTAFNGGVREAHGGTVDVSGGSTGPRNRVPDGCPTSAEEAASGGSGTGAGSTSEEHEADDSDPEEDDESLENVLVFDGSDEGVTRYEVAVDGEIVPSNYEGATIDDETEIEDGVAHGVVANWKDAFRFDGELTRLTVDGPATVSLNGDVVDPDDFGERLPHRLEVRGDGEPASYEITVDGTVEYAGDDEAEADVTVVSGTTVQSSNATATQQFRFSGALTDVTFTDGTATVLVDGEEIDPDEYGDQELLPHALVVDGTEAEGPSTYSFRVSGGVAPSEYRGASIDDEDVIEGRSVSGAVANWLDAYWFDGDVEEFRLLGDAAVHVEYNARDQ